jgi:hypothetical protein
MSCGKRNDTYRCLKEINNRSVLANIYLSNLSKLEKEVHSILQKKLELDNVDDAEESGKKYVFEDVEELTKNILAVLQPFTEKYFYNLLYDKGLLKEKKTFNTMLYEKEQEEKTKLEDEEVENELEEEETKLEVLVVEDKNPCFDSIYDTNKVQFEYTFEYPSLIAIRKGVCFKCSTYKSILYSNVANDTSSQMCQDCISMMFNDFKK